MGIKEGGGTVEDGAIVDMYFARDERAIAETGNKYGGYLNRVAMNVLEDALDASECVNDTYLGAWNAMPPTRPAVLKAFLGKLTRRISLNRLRRRLTLRRGGGEAAASIEELGEILPSSDDAESKAEARELTRALDRFLGELPARERDIFMRRYWYFDSLATIARASGKSEAAVKSQLHRTREKLRGFLEEEGWL